MTIETAVTKTQEKKYYIVERVYIGPNRSDDRYYDADEIQIISREPRTNASGEVRTNGWLGASGDWSVTAYGEYPTLEAACAAIASQWGEVRKVENVSYWSGAEMAFKPGKYDKYSAEKSCDWVYDLAKKQFRNYG